ncbi:alanine--tRNA ligase-related protein, partial [Vibrio campbellii]
FYAESCGQCGDAVELKTDSGVFKVEDTHKLGNAIAHHGVLAEGVLAKGDEVEAVVDAERRATISLNHSATHLLHAALRKVLGEHVTQKGSL